MTSTDRPAECPECHSTRFHSNGRRKESRTWKCRECKHVWTTRPGGEAAPGGREVSDEVSDTTRTITTRSADITTLEALLEYSAVDLSIWEVERHIVNSWEVTLRDEEGEPRTVTNYQVKAWLRRKREESREDILRAFREDAAAHAPKYAPIKRRPPESGNLLEISVPDIHLGLLAWGRETGGADYDVKIAEALYIEAVATLVQSAEPYGFDSIVLPTGSDMLHVNSAANTTAKGTPQDTDSRWQKRFTIGRRMIVAAVDRLRERAPVKIVGVPGNHDAEVLFYLIEALYGWYRNADDVEVDNSPRLRKYHQHGRCLIGWTHGHGLRIDQLPLLMAQEVPDLWAATRYREYHVGHLHHSQVKSYQQETESVGVRVVQIPSLAAPSSWMSASGYRAIREAQAFVWNAERGRVATLHYHPAGAEG